MIGTKSCPECGVELLEDAPEGLCPKCLLQQGLDDIKETPVRGPAVPTSGYPSAFVAPKPVELARHFPQLDILQLLGQGGMGAVYKARQVKLDRLVALKVLPTQLGRDPAFAERFIREARTLARLSHPHIVAVHDFGEVDGLFYFIMEYVDGVNLRERLQEGPLPPEEALEIVPQICEALQYAHEFDVVHRDIKPENILLDHKGRVKIADFGLAKIVGLTPTYLTLTGSHQVMGTLYYMAPEQMERPNTVDWRADIYSVGVVFYEMLTGGLPLGRFAPPSHKVPVGADIDGIVLRALEKEPERRYQQVGELKRDVVALRAGPPAPAPVEQHAGVVLSFPFTTYGGWSMANGLVRLEDRQIVLEYVTQKFSGLVTSEVKEATLAFKDITSLSLEKGWGACVLLIRVARLSAVGNLPGCTWGEIRLGLNRRDYDIARRLVDIVHGKPSGAAQSPRRQGGQPEPDLEMVQVEVSGPASGLFVTGIVAALAWALLLSLIPVRTEYTYWGAVIHRRLGEDFPGLIPIVAIPILILLFGAWRMRRCRSYEFAHMASLLAMLPWSPAFPLGLAMGIWSLVTLRRPEVRAAFAHRLNPTGRAWQQYQDEYAGPPVRRRGVFGAVKSFAHAVRYYCVDSLVGGRRPVVPPETQKTQPPEAIKP
jgi:tRNA A-37 threonylcarbamoyl transferase component Bud32